MKFNYLLIIIAITFFGNTAFAQKTNNNKKQNTTVAKKDSLEFNKKNKQMFGADVQAYFQNRFYTLDLFPHFGYHINDKVVVAAGPFINTAREKIATDVKNQYAFLGARTFSRAYFIKSIYFQAEAEAFRYSQTNSANQKLDSIDYGIHLGLGFSRGNINRSGSFYYNATVMYNLTQNRLNAYGGGGIPINLVFISGVLPAGTFVRLGAGFKF